MAGRNVAREQLPLREEHPRRSPVTPHRPSSGRRYSFSSRTLLRGASDAAIRCDVISRISGEHSDRPCGVSFLGFSPDFGERVLAPITQNDLVGPASFPTPLAAALNEATPLLRRRPLPPPAPRAIHRAAICRDFVFLLGI